jgi:hypothetical protein
MAQKNFVCYSPEGERVEVTHANYTDLINHSGYSPVSNTVDARVQQADAILAEVKPVDVVVVDPLDPAEDAGIVEDHVQIVDPNAVVETVLAPADPEPVVAAPVEDDEDDDDEEEEEEDNGAPSGVNSSVADMQSEFDTKAVDDAVAAAASKEDAADLAVVAAPAAAPKRRGRPPKAR